ncbi:MAG: glycosyltransferase family 39 protein [Verrucomicrobiae bacterium]|nr:glycosyltransferase family 39 protein [Verrucomicrobiae bacterium]
MAAPDSDSYLPFASCDEPRLDRLAWRLILVGSLVRLLYAALYPMNLAGDEAYYWQWGQHLDWGYFSKPPGIAWLMALVTTLGGDHTVTIRLTSAVIGVGSLLLVRLLARHLFDARAAVLAVLITLATPANVLLNLMLTIDAPLVFCWSAALWCLWQWVHDEKKAGLWLAGLSLALAGGYLSKQMMLIFPLLAIIWLATSPLHRARLKSPGFWTAIAISLIALLPPLWWNSQHDWVTFHHTGGQLAGDTDNRPFGYTFVEYLATQAGVLSPVIFFFVIATAVIGLKHFRKLGDAERFLIMFSAPAIGVMFLMSLRQTMLPNWAAVYYIAALLLVAAWLAGSTTASLSLPARWRRATRPALIIGFVMVAVGYLWAPALEALGYSGHPKLDPMRRLRGHQVSAEALAPFLEKVPRPDQTFIVAQDHRYNASQLGFYLPGQPEIYRWERYDQIASQYELWPNPVDDGKVGWDALVIMPNADKKIPLRFQGAFESFELIGTLDVPVSPHYERHFRLFLGKSLKEWPQGMAVPGTTEEPAEAPDSDS